MRLLRIGVASVTFAMVLVGAQTGLLSAQATFPGDNGLIVFTHGGPVRTIYVINADGTGLTQLTTSDGTYADGWPRWSPDGTKIAFFRGGFDTLLQRNFWDIYVMNANGTGLTNITHTAGEYVAAPTWSPDGSKIAYQRCEDPECGETDIWVVSSDGTNNHPILTGPTADGVPTWSPDGKTILFTRTDVIGTGASQYMGDESRRQRCSSNLKGWFQ